MKNSLGFIFISIFFCFVLCGFSFPIPNEIFRAKMDKSSPTFFALFLELAGRREVPNREIAKPQPLESFINGMLTSDLFSRAA